MIWRVIILFLAYWLLAAHFLRDGDIVICTVIALFPLLVFSKHIIALRALQIALILAIFVVWLPSTYSIAEYRIASGNPWIRMGVIMLTVMLYNLFAAWCLSALIPPKKILSKQ